MLERAPERCADDPPGVIGVSGARPGGRRLRVGILLVKNAVASPLAPSIAASKDSANAATDGKRSSGSFDSARSNTILTAGGKSARYD
ncbi:MAG: hypothetical protein HND48_12550 [Chloroflexi bacterium]|nr:hypothetical protein [Chloroflexota bacterium]